MHEKDKQEIPGRVVEEIVEEILEEIDLEQFAKAGKKPHKAKRYRIRVDDKYYVVHQHTITGREVLTLAGKLPPENFILTLKIHGGHVETIGLDDIVELTRHGVERFNTLPRQVQEG
jgi:hypothetical protein